MFNSSMFAAYFFAPVYWAELGAPSTGMQYEFWLRIEALP